MKVGLFGGTFNPPHNTHIAIAKAAQSQLGLDKLIVMPCGLPPHKFCEVDGATRLALTKLAFPFAEVSDFEMKKQGASYTVETLRMLKEKYPQAQLFLVIGGDSFRNFDKWFCPQEIAQLATLAVACREHKNVAATARKNLRLFGAKAVMLQIEPTSTSSTEIRLRYQFGLDNTQTVSQQVNNYILQHGLYTEHSELVQKLKGYLKEKRFLHTFYVVKRGLELAEQAEREKVFVACLLHDCAKHIPPEKYAYYGFEKPSNMPEPVVHAFLGACVAQKDFGVTDREILDAIAYHTTGCPNMTRLQKIVYVADKTEQTRPYPLAHLLTGSLDSQFKKCLLEAASYTEKNDFPLSAETLNYYTK